MRSFNKHLNFFTNLILIAITVIFFSTSAMSQSHLLENQYKVTKGERPVIELSNVPEYAFEPGVVIIKFNPSFEAFLERNPPQKNPSGIVRFNKNTLDDIFERHHVTDAVQHFASPALHMGFTERHKAWGFHLWYKLTFEDRNNVKELITQLMGLDEIAIAEPEYKKMHVWYDSEIGVENVSSGTMLSWTPNDPQFSNQWHYHNTGQVGGTPGADIDLVNAWDLETGNSDVIVAIVDDGIQFNHPDISGNMWPGIGYNFVAGNSNVVPGNHGTHVAGTIAAVNNNATGVAGVAGGSGSSDGVRLMSCQVFTSSSSGGFHLAPVWAADNGASISQNSWGYTTVGVFEQSVLNAIDYFNVNGGGNAMNGGITIFASGNSNASGAWYPGFYTGAFAVAATNNQDVRSYYSNYGPWIDVSAPGGETNSVNARGVYSTVTGGNYAYYQGTSMACPHASGVAALVISHAIGELTAEDVADILRISAFDHYAVNPGYIGQLGTGRVNAYQALLETQAYLSGIPNPTSFSASEVSSTEISLSWNKNAENHDVMVAWSPDNNFGIPDSLTSYEPGSVIPGGGIVLYSGSGTSFNHSGLESATQYSYRAWSYSPTWHYSSGRPASAITSCEIFQLPFEEDFETLQSIPLCWIQESVSGSATWKIGTGNGGSNPPNAYNGTSNVYFKEQTLSSNGFTTRLVTPEMNLANYDSVELRFWYTNHLRTFLIWNLQDILRVRYKTSASSAWQTMETYNTNVDSWTEVVLNLPNLTETYYIAFEAESGLGHGVCIDQVTIIGEGELIIHTIQAVAGDNGTIEPSGQISVIEGKNQLFEIVADTGYSIGTLLIDGLSIIDAEGQAEYEHTFENVTQNHAIIASFALNIYSIEVTIEPIEAGVVEGTGDFFHGDEIELLADPLYGYEFVNWTEDGEEISTSNYLAFTAVSDRELQANFTPGTWSIGVTVDPEGAGIVEGDGDHLHTTTVELLAVPSEDYTFLGWFEDDEITASDNPYLFTANVDRNLTARFQVIGASVSSHENEFFRVYPNPNSGIFHVDLLKPATIKIYDISGREIYSEKLPSGSRRLDISSYKNGLYYIGFQNDESNRALKLIKE